jgi:hypothetical protein
LQVQPPDGYGAEYSTLRSSGGFSSTKEFGGVVMDISGKSGELKFECCVMFVWEETVTVVGGFSGKKGPGKLLDFVLADEIEASAPVTAVVWLGEQVAPCWFVGSDPSYLYKLSSSSLCVQLLAYLTRQFEVVVIDTVSLTPIEVFSVVDVNMVNDAYTLAIPSSLAAEEPHAASMIVSYQNTFRVCDGCLYIVGVVDLRRVRYGAPVFVCVVQTFAF